MPIEPSAEWMSKGAGLGEVVGRMVSPKYYKGRDTIDARLAGTVSDMNAVAAKRGSGVPVTDADRARAQRGWEDNRLWGKINDAYEKNYKDWAGKWLHSEGDDYGNVVRRSFGNARRDTAGELGTILPSPSGFGGAQEADRDKYNRDAKLGDYGSTKQAAEGSVPSAGANMPAHEESRDTRGNEVNPFEKVVKAYNTYKAKSTFNNETLGVVPNVTGTLPPAPGNLVREWYAKEHGMERQASVMEKQAVSWNGAKYWLGKMYDNVVDLHGKIIGGKWSEIPEAAWNATQLPLGFDAAKKQVSDVVEWTGTKFGDSAAKAGAKYVNSPEGKKALQDAGGNLVQGAWDKVTDGVGKVLNGNHIGNFFGLGGENWKWLAGALGLGALGYGAYRMFSGGGGSGGGWGGGAANSSAYYRNRHGYNHPDYEGMMVDNMMARRGGYGY